MDIMAANRRTANTAIKESLPEKILSAPAYFDFDQLVYVIESLKDNIDSLGEASNPAKEAIRIHANPIMHPEHGEIDRVEINTSGIPEVFTNFLNLIGATGPLPIPYTEIFLERLKAKDKAALHFLDIFNHRLISLLHRLRKKNYPHLCRSAATQTPLGKVARDLSGFDINNNINHTVFFDHYWRRSRSLTALLQLIEGFFKITAQILPFEGTWRVVDKSAGTKIGVKKGKFNQLGNNSILGLRAWDQTAGFTIDFPELTWDELQKFLPFQDKKLGGSNFEKLQKIILGFMGCQPRIFISLKLKHAENKIANLKGKTALGWNSWLSGNKTDIAKIKLQ